MLITLITQNLRSNILALCTVYLYIANKYTNQRKLKTWRNKILIKLSLISAYKYEYSSETRLQRWVKRVTRVTVLLNTEKGLLGTEKDYRNMILQIA